MNETKVRISWKWWWDLKLSNKHAESAYAELQGLRLNH
ncbi:hypothetical protein OIU74_002207 [Salix koriyanagi]|uniref:Uncharacterized protein n=1 Tax=Salix koriyanagi TaxID=2511006 RepID=A0A9Q1ANY1_9ROSI|nr:hypothetical protein OIU74_002207 [Salix koriyanagi]